MAINFETALETFMMANGILTQMEFGYVGAGEGSMSSVPYTVYAGQLLSMYRQYEIAPHANDTDLDFAVMLPRDGDHSWWIEEVRRRFHEAGFTDGPKESLDHNGWKRPCQECFYRDGTLVDIITYQPAADGESMFCIQAPGRKVLPIRLFHDRQQFYFKGRYYPMLWPAVEYCRLNWGEDWRTPKESKAPWYEETLSLTRGCREWM